MPGLSQPDRRNSRPWRVSIPDNPPRMTRFAYISVLLVVLLGALAGPAAASKTQESIIQDDRLLMDSGTDVRNQTLDQVKALGADTIRVNAIWARLAPERDSATKPSNFDATDSGTYPAGAFDALDGLVAGAAARGIGVLVTVTGPVPKWASPCGDRRTCDPNAAEFRSFVTAVGRRYSGNFVPGSVPSTGGGGLPLPLQQAQTGATLPRVTRWSIWNEPDLGSWLTPQYTGSSKKPVPASARIYRGLLYAALDGLSAAGHGGDQTLIGETAPIGRTSGPLATRGRSPLPFYRDLLCIDSKGHATSSKSLGCNGTFRKLPGAVAHHPYAAGAISGPTAKAASQDVPFASLRNLYRVLDQGAARKRIASKAPVYLTEYGIQTKPPDKFGVALGTQARLLNQADWMAYRDSRVRSVSQYEINDPPEVDQFNTGLRQTDGKVKPSLAAYQLPIWVSTKRVWGQVRTGGSSAALQWRASSKKSWKTYKTVKLNAAGYFDLKVSRSGGLWRLVSGSSAGRTASGY
jgi:hypothetical protein